MSDYNFLMETRLSPAQFQVLNRLSRAAHDKDLNLYLVGGAVRDMTFGQATVRNLDFALEGDPEKLFRALQADSTRHKKPGKRGQGSEQGGLEVVRVSADKRLRALRLWFSNGVRAEIAQCRTETYTASGNLAASPSMIFEDLKRRDFAFNAMAISLHPNSRGLLLDPKNGVGDIERAEIRALHSRSFLEDPRRIYRLLRLGLRLGFKPEEKTTRWLEGALEERAWTNLSAASQGRELEAVLREEGPDKVLKLYVDRGILGGLDRRLGRIAYEQFRKVRTISHKIPGADPFLLNFHCLVSKLGPAQQKRLAQEILGDSQTVKQALNLQKDAKKVARVLSSSKCALPSHAYKLLSTQDESLLLFLLAYYPQAKIQSRVKNYLVKATQVRERLPRQELLAMGMKPGREFDKILERVFFDQLDGKIKTHQQLEKELRSLSGIKEPPPPPPPPPPPVVKPSKARLPKKKPEPTKAATAAPPAPTAGGLKAALSRHKAKKAKPVHSSGAARPAKPPKVHAPKRKAASAKAARSSKQKRKKR